MSENKGNALFTFNPGDVSITVRSYHFTYSRVQVPFGTHFHLCHEYRNLYNMEDPDYKIQVTYNSEICTGRVSSHAMALGSPVWEKFLFPPWSGSREAKDLEGQDVRTSPVQQLDFAEDDGEALLTLLRIAHLQFKEIPVTLPYDYRLNLAILVDQYDCIGIIRTWLATWLANEEMECKEPEHEGWLFIAWAFGRKEVFKSLVLKMVKEIVVDTDGVMFTSSGEPISQPMPDGIIGNSTHKIHAGIL